MLNTVSDCNCWCHWRRYEYDAALTQLATLATMVMPPMPAHTNGSTLIDTGPDETLTQMVQSCNVVGAPRTSRVIELMWINVVWPARCDFMDREQVAIRAVRAEDSDETAQDNARYLKRVQDGLMPYITELYHIVKSEPQPEDESEVAAWARRGEMAGEYLAYCRRHHGPASAAGDDWDSLLAGTPAGDGDFDLDAYLTV